MFFLVKTKQLYALKSLECNSTPLFHLVYAVLWICKLAPPPLTHSSSEIHSLNFAVLNTAQCQVQIVFSL